MAPVCPPLDTPESQDGEMFACQMINAVLERIVLTFRNCSLSQVTGGLPLIQSLIFAQGRQLKYYIKNTIALAFLGVGGEGADGHYLILNLSSSVQVASGAERLALYK